MSRKRKIENVSNRCRICLLDNGCMSNLFDESLEPKLKDLEKCTSIDIKDEQDLPKIICHVCVYKLEMWSEFKDQLVQSNELLLNHLEMTESADITLKKVKTDSPLTLPTGSPTVLNHSPDQLSPKNKYASKDNDDSSKDMFQNDIEMNEQTNENNLSYTPIKPTLVPMKIKSLTGKRGRTTERRKASTKRWVARKKALLAATGENASDTDSLVSDESNLSPVQKARAKTNVDEDLGRQKRIARELKNLETDMSGKYGIKHDSDGLLLDTDSDARRTRSRTLTTEATSNHTKANTPNILKKNKILSKDKMGKENDTSTLLLNLAKKNNVSQNTITPHLVKSELKIGNATYIVTSTLFSSEPQYLNKTGLSNKTPNEPLHLGLDENSQEKNTDIIDAVQLRRINPNNPQIPNTPSDNRLRERCLNIEVEGTEFDALKQVQAQLACFVENEMKNRLFESPDEKVINAKPTTPMISKSMAQTLDDRLKNIVERAIKKNLEETMVTSKSRTVSAAFIRSALKSKHFQPKVIVKRMDMKQENQRYKINNLYILDRPYNLLRKRRNILLPSYADYTSSFEDSDVGSNNKKIISRKVQGPACARRMNSKLNIEAKVKKEQTENNELKKEVVNSPLQNIKREIPRNESLRQGLLCSTCGKSFENRVALDNHMKSHAVQNGTAAPPRQKPKMMRCKRCHEIVESKFVKMHVCRSFKISPLHKCYVCNSTFTSEKLLIQHLDNHDQSEFKIENIAKIDKPRPKTYQPKQKQQNKINTLPMKSEKSAEAPIVIPTVDKIPNQNILPKMENVNNNIPGNTIVEMNNVSFPAIPVEEPQKNIVPMRREKETYTCFVCDKIFTDEEILKDHLQKHCDDMSEDEQSTNKDHYQCAICGESMESDDALEAHVQKHLFDDEDDNPNLISIGNDAEKSIKGETHQCLQCSEVFTSEMLLEMHMQAHEEEAAIAEWEKQGRKSYDFQCMICNEFFQTEEELSEHVEVHDGNVYTCQLCDKPFSSLEDLQQHVATH